MSSSQRDPSWSARPTRASGSPSGYARSVAWPSQWRSFSSNSRIGRSTSNVLRMAQLDRLPRQVRYGVQLAGVAWPQLFRPLVLELASHRPIREVLPGVHHWTAIHPRIRLPVDSYYIQPARVVLDPSGLDVVGVHGQPDPRVDRGPVMDAREHLADRPVRCELEHERTEELGPRDAGQLDAVADLAGEAIELRHPQHVRGGSAGSAIGGERPPLAGPRHGSRVPRGAPTCTSRPCAPRRVALRRAHRAR